MSKRNQKNSEMWDIFRHTGTPPPSQLQNLSSISAIPVLNPSKPAFLPSIQKPSRESLQTEDTPKLIPKFEDMPNVEVRGRLRELEIQMLDLRAGIERRLSSVAEEFPNRLHKELRIIQERDSFMWKENTQKQVQISDGLKNLQEFFRNTVENLNTEIVALKRKVEEVSVKHSNTLRDVEQIARVPRVVESQPGVDFSPLVASFREALAEEKRKREMMQSEYNEKIQELHLLVRTSYSENGKRLQEYRDQVLDANVEVRNQIYGIESTKEDRIKSESEYLKSVYQNLQRRLEDEVSQRTTLEKEHKLWTDSRLNAIQKMMKNEEKSLAEREGKILAMMQEGLSALHEIISRAKEANTASLSKVQAMTNENLKDLAQALSSIKDSLYSRIENLEFSLQEEVKIRSEGINSAHLHIQKVNESIDRQGLFLENQIMSTENRLKSETFEIRQENEQRDKNLKDWQTTFTETFELKTEEILEKLSKAEKKWETLFKDAEENIEKNSNYLNKTRIDLESSLEQVKNLISFEDGLIEQKVTKAVNLINDKLDQELMQVKNKVEKDLASTNAELFASLALRVEQTIRLSQEQIKAAVADEAKTRQSRLEALESLMKTADDKAYFKTTADLNREIAGINERLAGLASEDQLLKKQIFTVRDQTASSLESLFSAIDAAKENLQKWTEGFAGSLVENAKREMNTLVEVDRELLLKEIDKNKVEISKIVENLKKNLEDGFEDVNNENRNFNNELKILKENRVQDLKGWEERVGLLTSSMQEAINQSSEAVKAVSRALVLKEAAERNQGLESIMKSLQARIAALEDLLKFYTAKTAEELRAEFLEIVEKERSARQNNELAQGQINKKMKKNIKDQKDQQDVAFTLNSVLDSVVQKANSEKIKKNKENIENALKKWVQNFEKELEENYEKIEKISENLEKNEEKLKKNEENLEKNEEKLKKNEENLEKTEVALQKKILKSEKNLMKKFEVKNLIDQMIGLIENDDTNQGIKESQKNIEILFNNMKKLEIFINDSKESLQEELKEVEKREALNNEDKRERIERLAEKIEILESVDSQKAISLLVDQLELLKQELIKKQDDIDEIHIRQSELNNQQIEFVRVKSQRDQEIQDALKILADSNAKIDQNIADVQEKFPRIIQQIEKHDEELAVILADKGN
jgi:hypothetical protein